MFAIGHFALGIITGKGSSMILKTKANLPLLLAASVLPDIDLILQFVNPTLFMHRGLTHSIITITMLMIPLFIVYKKQAVPYYGALLSHSLIGDFLTGGSELFWPLSTNWIGIQNTVTSITNVSIEIILFAVTLVIILKASDLKTLLRPQNHNLALLIPLGASLGPVLKLGQEFQSALPQLLAIPILLAIPSLFYIVIFTYSIAVELRTKFKRKRGQEQFLPMQLKEA